MGELEWFMDKLAETTECLLKSRPGSRVVCVDLYSQNERKAPSEWLRKVRLKRTCSSPDPGPWECAP